jgi:hypothetical protein
MKALLVTIMAALLLISGAAWAESLVDVKVDELSKPLKPRWGKDPFMKLEDRGGPSLEDLGPTDLVVEGIISNGDRALAIINGGFFREGDIIDEFTIKEILSDRVLLQRGGKSFTLRIQGFTAAGPGKEAGQ